MDDFIAVPMLLDRNFIEFEAVTQDGTIRCLLDTGSTWNILNRDLQGKNNDHMVIKPGNIEEHLNANPENLDLMVLDIKDCCEMPVFKIGKKDFGKVTFRKIKMPYKIDAVIGMEFLHSKLVFLDFPNRKIYFYEKQI
ncbi:MAG: hypothetical protein HGB12_17540 [Bacteroidetes bacterium]|nr:hypothetical protein [Bacteroidota bacterium]